MGGQIIDGGRGGYELLKVTLDENCVISNTFLWHSSHDEGHTSRKLGISLSKLL